MRQATAVTIYFSKQELSDALELYVCNTHPALAGHFANGCDFEFTEHPNTGELAELAVTFRSRKEQLMENSDATRIHTKKV